MIALLLLPILISLFTMLVLHKSSQTAGIVGIITALLLAVTVDGLRLDTAIIHASVVNTLILSLTAFCVILPGLTLGVLLDEYRYNAKIRDFLAALPIDAHHKVLILLFGLLPAIESITGFGVSLILAVPLFFSLYHATTAAQLSMLSMNIISWGTLGLSTMVGSKLAGMDAPTLGVMTAYFVPLYLLLFSMTAFKLLKQSRPNLVDIGFCALLIAVFGTALYFANRYNQVELAGVVAGFISFVVFCAYFLIKNKQSLAKTTRTFLIVMMPYLLVVVFVIIIKLLVYAMPNLLELGTLHGHGVNFVLFASPCLAITLTILSIAARHRHYRIHLSIAKSIKACATLFIFILLAQLMGFAGFISALIASLDGVGGLWLYVLILPIFAMLSGFVTGSNLGGNALLMDISVQLGDKFGHDLLFAAIQNAGAGFAVFTSMPLIILICTIASQNNVDGALDEKSLLSFGLKLLLGVYASIIATAAVLLLIT